MLDLEQESEKKLQEERVAILKRKYPPFFSKNLQLYKDPTKELQASTKRMHLI